MAPQPDPISPTTAPTGDARIVVRYFGLILWAIFFAVVAVFVGGILIPAVGAGALIVLLIPTAIAGAAWEIGQKRRASAVLTYIEQATRLNLPLPAMLGAAEQSETGGLANALQRVRKNLENGQTIHDSVAAALPALPPRKLGLIGSAERCGRLPTVLQRLTREDRARRDPRAVSSMYVKWYPLLLVIVSAGIIAMISIFVLPKLLEIFHDFQVELPPQTVVIFDLWQFATTSGGLYLLLILMALLMLAVICVTPTPVARDPLRGLSDRLKWHIPGLAGMTRWRAMADVCNVIADALEVGRPLDWALTEASRSGTNRILAEQLAVWADHVRAGVPVVEGARRAKLPPLLVGLLRTGPGAGLADVYRFLARYYDSRFARAVIVLQAVMVPLISIVMGSVVLFIVYSLFVPLIRLVDSMTNMPGSFR